MLLFYDFQNFHGASLDTNAAGNALGGRTVFGSHHNLHGANLNALTAGGAELLIDHVDTGLSVLSDSTSLTDLRALATLDADHRLCLALLLHDLDAGQILMELLIKSSGTSIDTLQASHALCTLLNNKLLHNKESPLLIVYSFALLYKNYGKIAMLIFNLTRKFGFFLY